MQRTPFGEFACSIARAFDVVGEPWTALILRDASVGITRFDDLQRDLGLSRKVLSERLHTLVERGVIYQQPYQHNPVRHDYLLTEKGQELAAALLPLLAWGDRWEDRGAGPPVLLHHETCGRESHAVVVCSACQTPLDTRELIPRPGPGARPGRATQAVGAAIARRRLPQHKEHQRSGGRQ